MGALELHHSIPRCLLGFFDRASEGDLDPAGLQAWFEWEEEAFRYGVDPDVSREELELLIEASASPAPATVHRSDHSRGGDFVRWGRRGGLRTLALYGRGWFVLLVGRRWEKITAEQLAEPAPRFWATGLGCPSPSAVPAPVFPAVVLLRANPRFRPTYYIADPLQHATLPGRRIRPAAGRVCVPRPARLTTP